jgi:catechol 2,3-dioxygenase-like lactoylglutathione lyase family enzyme
MLSNYPTRTELPASDFDRAKKFYGETLELELVWDQPMGARYRTGDTFIDVYPSAFAGTNQGTAVSFEVDDVEKVVEYLEGRGITFEQYDLEYLKTDARGIAEQDGFKGAWFKDTEGNILAIGEMAEEPK